MIDDLLLFLIFLKIWEKGRKERHWIGKMALKGIHLRIVNGQPLKNRRLIDVTLNLNLNGGVA